MFDGKGRETVQHHTGPQEDNAIIHVVGDILSGRQSLAALIDIAGWRVVTHASIEDFMARPRPGKGCLVLDASLLGLDDVRKPNAGILEQIHLPTILIGRNDISIAVNAIKAGAAEFLAKPINAWALLRAVDDAVAISIASLEKRLNMLNLHTNFASLSQRERQVMMLVARGRMNKQVAGDLGISEVTVKAHRGQAMRKMGARTFAELVNMAAKLEPIASRGDRTARRPLIEGYDGVAASIAQ